MTTEILALRIALDALAKEYARVCDEFCINPERHEEYNRAKELLRSPQKHSGNIEIHPIPHVAWIDKGE